MRQSPRAARPYAKALFALAKERQQTEPIGEELGKVAELLAGDAQLRDFFGRPWVSAKVKRSAADEISGKLELSRLVRDFLGLVAAKGRAEHLPAIAAAYREMADAEAGRVRARVRTAVALTAEERRLLAQRLGHAFGGKQVVIDEVIDTTLLGGFVAESGSVIVDGSLETQFAHLRQRLVSG